MKVESAQLSLPKVGEIENGDRAVTRREADVALFAVIDGLGHGPEAAGVASTAASYLESVSLDTPLLDIMEHIHADLSGTRGAAATVCLVRNGVIEACAVGNVELRSADIRLPLVFSAGVLGAKVRRFHVCQAPLRGRGRLVLFSDGISSRTPLEDFRRLAPSAACNAIMQKHRRVEDDSTVLVADLE